MDVGSDCRAGIRGEIFDRPNVWILASSGMGLTRVLCMHQGILVASVFVGSKIDQIIARSQRRELGLCEECGGLNDPAICKESRCPGPRPVSSKRA